MFVCYLVGNIGAHQDGAGNGQDVGDEFRDELDAPRREDVEALDEGEGVGALLEFPGERPAGARDELVRKDEDEEVGLSNGLLEVRYSDDVLGQGAAGQVLER